MPINVLSVAEKPSVAKELAKIMANGENYQKRPGLSCLVPVNSTSDDESRRQISI